MLQKDEDEERNSATKPLLQKKKDLHRNLSCKKSKKMKTKKEILQQSLCCKKKSATKPGLQIFFIQQDPCCKKKLQQIYVAMMENIDVPDLTAHEPTDLLKRSVDDTQQSPFLL